MLKVAVSYRVLQEWRVPIFRRLSILPGIDLKVFYDEDFENTKVKSFNDPVEFSTIKLNTIKFRFQTSHGDAYVPFSPSLFYSLLRFEPDVIITEGASNFINNLCCFIYAKMFRKKIIQWGIGEIEGRARSIQRILLDSVFSFVEKYSDGAIAYSSFGAQYYVRKGIDHRRVVVAVNVVDTEERVSDFIHYCCLKGLVYPSQVPDVFNVLFVGALAENKGVDILIRAFMSFIRRVNDPHARLTIVGDGVYRSYLEELVSDLKLGDRVFFAGHVRDRIGAFFYDASIFVMPGLGGLAVSDALAHGVPVLCGIGDGCEKDLINNGKNGIILSKIDEYTLCDQFEFLWANRPELVRMRFFAQDFCKSNLGVVSYVNNIEMAIKLCALSNH